MNSAWTSYLFVSGLGFLSLVCCCPLGIEIESWSDPLWWSGATWRRHRHEPHRRADWGFGLSRGSVRDSGLSHARSKLVGSPLLSASLSPCREPPLAHSRPCCASLFSERRRNS